MALAVAQVTGTNFGSASTAHAVDISSTNVVNAGELLIGSLGWPTTTTSVSATDSTGDAWTRLDGGAINGAANVVAFAKIADGDEDSATVGITTGASEDASGCVYRITGFAGTLADDIDISAKTTGTGDANPASVTAGWGSAANLFIVLSLLANNEPVNTNPANYTEGYEVVDAGVDHTFWTGYRLLTAASDDPGVIDYDDPGPTDAWATLTLVIGEGGATPVEITGSPATLASSGVAAVLDLEPITITASPATLSASAIAPVVQRAVTTITGTPAVLASSAIAGALELGAYTLIGSPASLAASAIAPVLDLAVTTITGTQAVLVSSAHAPVILADDAPVEIEGSPAILASSAIAADLEIFVIVEASPATLQAAAQSGVIELGALEIEGDPAVLVAAAMPADIGIPITIIGSPAVLRATAWPGVRLPPPRLIGAFYKRVHRGNRPIRMGWKRPPSWR